MRIARSTLSTALVGALAGLPVGVLEAARLWFVPAGLLPALSAGYGIWLVAPLLDLSLGGLLGLVFGLIVGTLCQTRGIIAKLTAAGLGAAAAVLACFVAQVISPLRDGRLNPTTSWCFFTALFVPALLAYYHYARDPVRRLLGREEVPTPKGLVVTFFGSVAVLLVGLAVFELAPAFTPSSVQADATPLADRPNIVLITLDTVRADHLSLYGYPRPTSSNLDRWAQQGVVFDSAVASSSWTLASHASVFTGLLPHQHGANWFTPVDSARWTLAEILTARGYETGGFSSNVYYGEAGWGMEHGFQVYSDAATSLRHNLQLTFAGRRLLQPFYYSFVEPNRFDRIDAAQLNLDVFHWLRRRSGRPFFLFVNYFDAHSPYLAPRPYDRRFGRASDELLRKAQPILEDGTPANGLSAPEREAVIANYDNCLAYLDEELDRFLQTLSRQRDWSNTVVIVTSDHGEAFGEHGFYGHGNGLHRETIHVPLVVLGRGIPAGRRIVDTVTTRKLFPTVLDMALGVGEPFQSNSLRRYWEPGFKPGLYNEIAVSELAPRRNDQPGYISLTTSQWQLIQDTRGRTELYRWKDAEGEIVNLAQAYPGQTRALEAFLRERIAASFGPWAEPHYVSALEPQGGRLNPTLISVTI